MGNPEISIVIRTFNEEKYLPDLLDALKRQSFQYFETIVVDSGSMDRSREIGSQKADKLLPIESRDFTFGHSLNVGIQGAAGDFIAIVSAHTLPLDENWLNRLTEPLREDKTAMVYGRQIGGKTSKYSEIQDLRRTFGLKPKTLRPPRFFANNANSAIRKDLWQKHAFDESLLGLEDIEWAKYWMERGYQVVYEPQAALYHFHDETWRQVRRRYYREAVAARRIGIQDAKHAIATPMVESIRTIFDLGRLLTAPKESIENPKRKFDHGREAILFRSNKTIGTIKGLLDGDAVKNQVSRENIFFDRSCRAVVIHGPGRASFDDIKIPEVKPGDVLIRVAYVAVCVTDLEIFDGSLGYYKNGMASYPIVPGHEFSGKVVSFGPKGDHLETGDSVVAECIQSCGNCAACHRENWIACQSRTELGVIGRNGGYAEYVVVPAHFVHRLPADFDLRTACLVEPLAVALKGLKRLRRTWQAKKEPKQCAVVGAGPIGNLCAQVLSLWGHQVTVFDRNPRRLDYFKGSAIEVADDLGRLSEFENLIEVTGDPEALDAMIHQSPAGATIMLLGLPYAHRKFTFESIVAYDKIVVGSVGSSAKHFKIAIDLLPQIDTNIFTDRILPLESYAQAWKLARSQEHLKILLQID